MAVILPAGMVNSFVDGIPTGNTYPVFGVTVRVILSPSDSPVVLSAVTVYSFAVVGSSITPFPELPVYLIPLKASSSAVVETIVAGSTANSVAPIVHSYLAFFRVVKSVISPLISVPTHVLGGRNLNPAFNSISTANLSPLLSFPFTPYCGSITGVIVPQFTFGDVYVPEF